MNIGCMKEPIGFIAQPIISPSLADYRSNIFHFFFRKNSACFWTSLIPVSAILYILLGSSLYFSITLSKFPKNNFTFFSLTLSLDTRYLSMRYQCKGTTNALKRLKAVTLLTLTPFGRLNDMLDC
jgi:hypothetical protein